MNDGMYRVVSGGFWRDPTWKFDNDLGPGLQEVIQPGDTVYHNGLNVSQIEEALNGILERHENQVEELDRRITFRTGPEGMRQFNEALWNELSRERVTYIIDEVPQVSTGIFEAATPTISSGLGTIQIYGTGGANREYGEYVAGYDPYVPTGEEIRNSQSISTTRHFETEEEAINYLDSLSNDI